MDLKNKKIAILGAGVEGKSTLKYLNSLGLQAELLDEHATKAPFERLPDFDIVFRSPGIPLLRPELQEFKKKGGEISSQMKYFFENCPCSIIGVTGTKGKGTTASLIHEMLKAEGKDSYLGGNIGTPPLDFLDKLKKDSVVVLELSSYQLQDLDKSPHIALMLMTTSEHLDHHKDISEYVDAKRNILRFQNASDFAIINRDYPASNESDVLTEGKVYYVSREREVDEGCFVKEGKVVLRVSKVSGVSNVSRANDTVIIETSEILLPGKHNLENICAAVLAAHLAGVEKERIVKVLKSFKGLVHRLELIKEVGGVKYYDDSFSTIPETAIAAIESFESPEILILGGSSKNSDFTELGKVISNAKNIKAIIGIGDEYWTIKSEIRPRLPAGRNPKSEILMIEDAKDMKTVVAAASKIAAPGDVVLLSPACASFGMFKNYKDRGEQFKREVLKL